MKIKKEKIEQIQLDYGIIFTNYGEAEQELLGPTDGGGGFEATKELRDIPFDGMRGKTKALQVIDAVDAVLNVDVLDTSLAAMRLAMPYLQTTGTGPTEVIECTQDSIGVLPADRYLKNITMFIKTIDKKYKKITLYNAMNEGDFAFQAAQKEAGKISLAIQAHWLVEEEDVTSIDKLFTIEVIDTIVIP